MPTDGTPDDASPGAARPPAPSGAARSPAPRVTGRSPPPPTDEDAAASTSAQGTPAAARVWLPRALGLVAFAAYAWLAAPGPYWLDSQELAAAAVRLGVPHPTGFPLSTLLGHVVSWLPLGELAWRVHLASALAAAVAVWQVARLTAELGGDEPAAVAGGAAAATLLGASLTFHRAATVTEVYALTAALVAIALRLTLRVARGGRAPVGLPLAFLTGLAAAGAHASFRLLLGVPLALLFLWRLWRGARWVLAAPLLVALGAAAAASYLPARSATGRVAGLDWGHPSTARALIDHVAAARIRAAFGERMLSGEAAIVRADAAAMARQVEEDLGAIGLLFAAAGGAALLLRRGRRTGGVLLLVVAAGDLAYAIWINPMGIAERQNGVPLVLALAALGGAGVATAVRGMGRAAPYAAGALAVVAAVEPALADARARLEVRRSDAARALAERALDTAPPGAIVLAQSDSLAAGLLWSTEVEGARPDVAALVRQHLWDTARVEAVLAASAGARPTSRRAEDGTLAAQRESGWRAVLSARRPLRWEPGDDVPPRGWRLWPGVPVGELVAADAAGEGPARDAIARNAAWLGRTFPGAPVDPPARETAARAWLRVGVLASHAGDPRAAAAYTERALALRPGHPRALVNLARYRLALGEDDAARRAAERAIAVAPGDASAWALLGTVAARAGRCEHARRLLDRALALDPGERDARRNRALLDRGCRPPARRSGDDDGAAR